MDERNNEISCGTYFVVLLAVAIAVGVCLALWLANQPIG